MKNWGTYRIDPNQHKPNHHHHPTNHTSVQHPIDVVGQASRQQSIKILICFCTEFYASLRQHKITFIKQINIQKMNGNGSLGMDEWISEWTCILRVIVLHALSVGMINISSLMHPSALSASCNILRRCLTHAWRVAAIFSITMFVRTTHYPLCFFVAKLGQTMNEEDALSIIHRKCNAFWRN